MSKIIKRPMYKTDPDFKKGMKVLVIESTGEIISKHFDNPKLPEEYKNSNVINLSYNEINWNLAGY